ncbi:RPS15A isoform 13, partial [Pongo abelii]
CGVISPRFDVQLKDLEKWQNNLLPSRQFGIYTLQIMRLVPWLKVFLLHGCCITVSLY